jgi:hypothetical protein
LVGDWREHPQCLGVAGEAGLIKPARCCYPDGVVRADPASQIIKAVVCGVEDAGTELDEFLPLRVSREVVEADSEPA